MGGKFIRTRGEIRFGGLSRFDKGRLLAPAFVCKRNEYINI
jgi:hypothetical protein